MSHRVDLPLAEAQERVSGLVLERGFRCTDVLLHLTGQVEYVFHVFALVNDGIPHPDRNSRPVARLHHLGQPTRCLRSNYERLLLFSAPYSVLPELRPKVASGLWDEVECSLAKLSHTIQIGREVLDFRESDFACRDVA